MRLGGYTGKNLLIDVSKKSFKAIDWTQRKNDWLKLVGGRGFGAKIIWENTDKNTDPLGPDGIITLNTGPLTGLPIPGAGRISLCAISPQTGNMGRQQRRRLRRSRNQTVRVRLGHHKGKKQRPHLHTRPRRQRRLRGRQTPVG